MLVLARYARSAAILIKYSRLSHDVVTCDVDRDVSTAYCQSSSGDEVDWLRVTLLLLCTRLSGTTIKPGSH